MKWKNHGGVYISETLNGCRTTVSRSWDAKLRNHWLAVVYVGTQTLATHRNVSLRMAKAFAEDFMQQREAPND